MTSRPRKAPTLDAMAAALDGVTDRTVQRWFKAGMPRPEAGEAIGRWAGRARRWLAARAQAREGRPVSAVDATAAAWLAAFREVRARRCANAAARRRSKLHTAAECQDLRDARRDEVAAALAVLPAMLADSLAGPDKFDALEIQKRADEAVRWVCQGLAGTRDGARPPAQSDAEPLIVADDLVPPTGLSAEDMSTWWLARGRRAKTESEQTAEQVDDGRLHDVRACEQVQVRQHSDAAILLRSLPERWARSLLHLREPAAIHGEVAQDLARVVEVLDGKPVDDAELDDGEDHNAA